MTDQSPRQPWEADIRQEPLQIPEAEPEQPAAPTYPLPAKGLTVPEARDEIDRLVEEFVARVLAPPRPGIIDFNRPTVTCIGAPAGVGKTTIAAKRALDLLRAGKKVVFAVPTHALGEQIVRDLEKKAGARVYRSRDAADPEAQEIDVKMCREPKRTVAIGGALGEPDIDACKSSKGICDHHAVCGYQRQKRNPPQIWIVAHQCMFLTLPPFIPKPDVVIVDEAFYKAAIDKDLKMHVDWLINAREDKTAFPVPWGGAQNLDNLDLIEASELAHHALVPLVVRGRRSRISRDMFSSLTAAQANAAQRLEWRRKRHLHVEYPDDGMKVVYPGQDQGDAIYHAGLREEHNRKVKALAKFWEYLEALLDGDAELSLNLYFQPSLEIDREARPGIRIKSRRELHPWVTDCLILHLDATMNEVVVRRDLPYASFHNVPVAFPPVEVVFIQQLTDRLMGANATIPKEGASDNRSRESRLRELRRSIDLEAAWHTNERVVVICQEELEKLLAKGKPYNVTFAHFNALRGRNDLTNARALIVIGRTEPSPGDLEDQARLQFGREVKTIPDGQPYYDEVMRTLSLRGGYTVPVKNYAHPDEGVEALRWLACEAELIQAVYRARPLTRTLANRLSVYVMTSVALPVRVDLAGPWSEMQPSLFQLMLLASGGIATDSPTDAAAIFPELFKTVKAAENALQRKPYVGPKLVKRFVALVAGDGTGMSPQISMYRPNHRDLGAHPTEAGPPTRAVVVGLFAGGDWPAIRTIKYRRVGSRANRPSTLYYDPTRIEDPLAGLRARLGRCDVVLIEGDNG
jgi:hypothetical protein